MVGYLAESSSEERWMGRKYKRFAQSVNVADCCSEKRSSCRLGCIVFLNNPGACTGGIRFWNQVKFGIKTWVVWSLGFKVSAFDDD